MCGLVGMAGNISKKEKEVFSDMLAMDVVRGPHSTGVASIYPDGVDYIVKQAVLPHDLFQHQQYKRRVTDGNPQVLIGHNRWATQGRINNINAHPFTHGTIVGAHNGTLRDQTLLPEHQDFEVDSENLIYSIDKLGIEETLKRTRGAFALSLYDAEHHRVMLVRNAERPLWVTETKRQDVVLWASEPWMLRAACTRRGLDIESVFQLEELKLYEFDLPEQKYNNMPECKITKVQEAPPVKKTQVSSPKRPAGGGGAAGTAALTINGQVQQQRKVKPLREDYWKYIGKRVEFLVEDYTKDEIRGVTEDGIMVKIPFKDGLNDLAEEILVHDDVCDGRVFSVFQGNWDSKKGSYSDGYLKIEADSVLLIEHVPETVPADGMVKGPRDSEITAMRYHQLTKDGCSWCTSDLDGPDVTEWYGDFPLCIECNTNMFIEEENKQ